MSIVLKDGTVLPDIPTAYTDDGFIGVAPDLATLKYHAVFYQASTNTYYLSCSDIPVICFEAGANSIMFILIDMDIGQQSENYSIFGCDLDDTALTWGEADSGPVSGNGFGLFENSTPVVWSDHNIMKLNVETGEEEGVFFPSSVSKPPFILPDGTELPPLPDGCFDGTPYGIISIFNDGDCSILTSQSPVYVEENEEGVPTIFLSVGKDISWYLVDGSWQFFFERENDTPLDWMSFAESPVKWSNHDIMHGTEIARKSDENYRVTGGYMTSIANEARRLGGKTGGMLPETVESTIRSAKSFPNGTQWTKSNVTSGYCNHKIVFGDGVWVAGKFFSKDGKTWQPTNYPAGFYDNSTYVHPFGLAYGNGVFCSGSRTESGLCYSEDGETWTKSNIPNVNVYTPAYADGLWCAATIDYGIYYSKDGKTWQQSNKTSCNGATSIRKVNGIWYATASDTYYSMDGKTWAAINSPVFISRIAYHGGVFVGTNYNNGIYYSDDGITWTKAYDLKYFFGEPVYANGIWVLQSRNGLYYSYDGKSWTQSNVTSSTVSGASYYMSEGLPVYANGVWVSGSSEGLYYSDDGVTWTKSNVTSGDFGTPVYANGLWVACDGYDSDARVGVYYSKDGKTWTPSNIGTGRFMTVLNENGIWVIGEQDKGFYYSVTWE